jgi:Flp pilus assembly protein TadG
MVGKTARRGWRDGNSAIEFALVSPVLVTLMLGSVDFGLAVYYKAQLQNAVRAGAQYATGTGRATDNDGITATIQGASRLTGIEVTTPSSSCRCADGSTIACTGATCGDGSAVGAYLDLSASYTYTPFITFFESGPRTLSFSMSVRTS